VVGTGHDGGGITRRGAADPQLGAVGCCRGDGDWLVDAVEDCGLEDDDAGALGAQGEGAAAGGAKVTDEPQADAHERQPDQGQRGEHGPFGQDGHSRVPYVRHPVAACWRPPGIPSTMTHTPGARQILRAGMGAPDGMIAGDEVTCPAEPQPPPGTAS
jgi:hypothetical protein